MSRFSPLAAAALAAALASLGPAAAQPVPQTRKEERKVEIAPAAPAPAAPAEAAPAVPHRKARPETSDLEVRFLDGSAVRVTPMQASIEVSTKYGPLTVPLREVRRADFGVHLDDATRERVEAAVRRLGADDFRTRDAATNELVALGPAAYPALTAARKSTNPEVARRAADAVKHIRSRTPAASMRLETTDKVVTDEFPLVGRVTSEALKVRTTYFGERDVKLADVLSLKAVGATVETDLTVDATKHGGNPPQWMETEVEVTADTRLTITATGQVDLYPQDQSGRYKTGPAGSRQGGMAGPHPAGMLLGRVGAAGTVFAVGEKYEGQPGAAGKLHLSVAPHQWGDPSVGAYRVKVVAEE